MEEIITTAYPFNLDNEALPDFGSSNPMIGSTVGSTDIADTLTSENLPLVLTQTISNGENIDTTLPIIQSPENLTNAVSGNADPLTGIAAETTPFVGDLTETTTATITATASGSQTPPTATRPETVINGDFEISGNNDNAPIVGDGLDERTFWTFDFTQDPEVLAFQRAESITEAKLTLELKATGGVNTDVTGIEGLTKYVDSSAIKNLPLNEVSTIEINLLDDKAYTSEDILGALQGGEFGRFRMYYDDDAIVSGASLELSGEIANAENANTGVKAGSDGRFGTAFSLPNISIFASSPEQDADGDGLQDIWENAAMQALNPILEHDEDEELFKRPDDKLVLFTRITHEKVDDRDYIFFLYSATYSEDYGRDAIGRKLGSKLPIYGKDIEGAHPGDTQQFQIVWEVKDPYSIELDRIRTSGHNRFSQLLDEFSRLLEIPDGKFQTIVSLAKDVELYEGRVKIYVEEDKHGTWSSRQLCEKYGPYDCGWDASGTKGLVSPKVYNVGEPDSQFMDETQEFPGESVWSDAPFRDLDGDGIGGDGKFLSQDTSYIGKWLEDNIVEEVKHATLQVSGGYLDGSGNYATSVAFGDVDGDGKDEIGITRNTKDNARYYIFDDKDNGFRLMYEDGGDWGSDNYATSIAFGDVDGDGIDEIGVTRKSPEKSRYWVKDDFLNGFNTLYEDGNGWGGDNYATSIAFGDVDGDGIDEIGVTRKAPEKSRYWVKDDFLNGFNTLSEGGGDWGSGNYGTSIAFGDVDGDGRDETGVTRKAPENGRYFILG